MNGEIYQCHEKINYGIYTRENEMENYPRDIDRIAFSDFHMNNLEDYPTIDFDVCNINKIWHKKYEEFRKQIDEKIFNFMSESIGVPENLLGDTCTTSAESSELTEDVIDKLMEEIKKLSKEEVKDCLPKLEFYPMCHEHKEDNIWRFSQRVNMIPPYEMIDKKVEVRRAKKKRLNKKLNKKYGKIYTTIKVKVNRLLPICS